MQTSKEKEGLTESRERERGAKCPPSSSGRQTGFKGGRAHRSRSRRRRKRAYVARQGYRRGSRYGSYVRICAFEQEGKGATLTHTHTRRGRRRRRRKEGSLPSAAAVVGAGRKEERNSHLT